MEKRRIPTGNETFATGCLERMIIMFTAYVPLGFKKNVRYLVAKLQRFSAEMPRTQHFYIHELIELPAKLTGPIYVHMKDASKTWVYQFDLLDPQDIITRISFPVQRLDAYVLPKELCNRPQRPNRSKPRAKKK